MKSKFGSCIDILDGETGKVPMQMELTNGLTLVSMSKHGTIKLRLHTHYKTELSLSIDSKPLLKRMVASGVHVFDSSDNAEPLNFRAPPANGKPAIAQFEMDAITEDDDGLPEANTVLKQPFVGLSGRVHLHLRYFVDDSGRDIFKHQEDVVLQLNTAEDHLTAIAENYHRIVPVTEQVKPWCGCCRGD